MPSHVTLLPGNATPWERLNAKVNDPFATLAGPFDGIRAADLAPPPGFLPFLVWQYGLGELSPYLPNLYDLISEGIRWQRERGTPASISRGLGWLGYTGQIEEAPTRRKRWNTFQLALGRVRDRDLPDLSRINGIVDLSPPQRSRFVRGFAGYDVRAAETSYKQFSMSMLSDSSGVRIEAGKAKWSFGRLYELDVTASQTELTNLGTWVAPPSGQLGLWTAETRLWVNVQELWASLSAIDRFNVIADNLIAGQPWVRFVDAGGQTIGYARTTVRKVGLSANGEYPFGGSRYTTSTTTPAAVLITGTSGFGDGAGATATSVRLVFGGSVAPGLKPGRLWLPPGGLVGGTEVAPQTVNIPFGLTVRERVRYLLRF